MATPNNGYMHMPVKNLREVKEDRKTRAGSKSQATLSLPFAACASIFEIKQK